MRYKIDNDKSMIHWKGANDQNGSVHFEGGELFAENGKISGGRLVIDMTSIEMDKESMADQLKSKRYLDTDDSPQAAIQIIDVLSNPEVGDMPKERDQPDQFIPRYRIEGEVTIQNRSQKVIIPADFELKGDHIEAHSRFRLDRQEWVDDLLKEVSANYVPKIEIALDLIAYPEKDQ